MTWRIKPHDLFFASLCTGLVLVAMLVLFIAMAGLVKPAYAQDMECDSAERVKAAIRAMEGPVLEEVTDAKALRRVVAFMKAGGLKPPFDPDALLLITSDGITRIAWVKQGVTCGHVAISGELAAVFREVLAGTPDGRDA